MYLFISLCMSHFNLPISFPNLCHHKSKAKDIFPRAGYVKVRFRRDKKYIKVEFTGRSSQLASSI